MQETSPDRLYVLWEGSTEENQSKYGIPTFDVVAVHGLNGHPMHSWTDSDGQNQEIMWLKDFLPICLPSARIMTFGYSSYTVTEEIIQETRLKELAVLLLTALLDDRRNRYCGQDPDRPIVFICQNLGGIIVQQALSISQHSSTLWPIEMNTYRLVLFGTPRDTSHYSTWFDFALKVIITSGQRCEGILSSILQRSSETLVRLSHSKFIWRDYSSIDIHEKDAFTVPYKCRKTTYLSPATEPIYLEKDHRSICKFSEAEYERFLLLYEKIIHMNQSNLLCVESKAPSPKSATSLYQDYDDFIGNISARDTGICWPIYSLRQVPSFHWVLEHPSYSAWETPLSPSILHIHGQAGSGKTVMASFLVENLLTNSGNPDNYCLVKFSFHSAGKMRSSMASLYISFIRQLLSQQPSLFRHIRNRFSTMKTRSSWETNELLILFQSLVACQNGNRIICVIDAIDECIAAQPQLLEDLATLQGNTERVIKFILTSRSPLCTGCTPASYFELNLDDQSEMMLAELQGSARLGLSNLLKSKRELYGAEKIISQRLVHPCATFLSIELMLKQLETANLHTETPVQDEVRNMASSIPEIYKNVLSRVSVDGGMLARKTLCWILYTFRSMTVEELVIASSLDSGRIPFLTNEVSRLNTTEILDETFRCIITIEHGIVDLIHHSAREFLLSAIGKADQDQYLNHGDLVRSCLLHLSAEDRESKQSRDLDNGLSVAIEPGFWEYAAQYWPAHYKESSKTLYVACDVSNFLKNRSQREVWSEFYSQAWKLEPAQCTLWKESALLVATDLGFTEVIDLLIMEQNTRDTVPYSEQARAIDLAADNGDRDLVKRLLAIKAPNTPQGEKALHLAARKGHLGVVAELLTVKVDPNEIDGSGSTPLHLAAQFGHVEVAKELLKKGAVRNKANTDGFAPLHIAAISGNLEILQELLKENEPHTVFDGDEYNVLTPLHLAAREGHTDIAKHLLESGFIEVSNDRENSSLHLAAQYGSLGVIRLLLSSTVTVQDEYKLDVLTPLELAAREGRLEAVRSLLHVQPTRYPGKPNKAKSRALVLAAQQGYELIVKLILEPRAMYYQEDSNTCAPLKKRPTSTSISDDSHDTTDPEPYSQVSADSNFMDEDTRMTPLLWAAKEGHESVVRVLLRQPLMKPDLSDGILKQTPLSHAARSGHTPVVRLLLNQDSVSLNSQDTYGQTPLTWAAQNRNHDVVRLLLDRTDVKIDEPDNLGHTPLHWASAEGEKSTVSLLLEKGAKVEGGTNTTALQAAVFAGSQEVVEMLLDHGAEMNKESPPCGTALQAAAYTDDTELVQLLLKRGADCNNTSGDYGSALITAASEARKEIVEILLQHGADIDAKGKLHVSALQAAAETGDNDVVKLLLMNGADVNATGGRHGSALNAAVSVGRLDIVQLLIEEGADVDQDQGDECNTALHAAIQAGHTAIVELLLPDKAEMGRIRGKYATALQAAVSGGNLDIVQLLIDKGADVNLDQGEEHSTALQVAVHAGHKAAVELLLKCNADVNRVGVLNAAVHDLDITRLLLDHGANVNLQHVTLLRTAIDERRHGLVELLLERGANVKGINGEGALLLMAEAGVAGAVKLLLDKGISVNVQDKRHATSLHHAAKKLHSAVISLLLERGANVNSTNVKGCTALHEAIKGFESEDNKILQVAELLLNSGADISIKDTSGATALHLAAALGNQDLVPVLIEKFSEVDLRNFEGQTALHRAAINGHIDMVNLLLNKGAEVSIWDKNGATALHEAVRRDHVAVVQLLLLQGKADINVMDSGGETCLHRAAKQGNEEILLCLLEESALMDEEHETTLPDLLRMMDKDFRDYSTVVEILLRHCRINKFKVSEQDLVLARKVQEKSASAEESGIRYCDRCKGGIPLPDPFYHCTKCYDDNYDLCQDCMDLGLCCFDDNHQLGRYEWKGGRYDDWSDDEFELQGYKQVGTEDEVENDRGGV